jgi:short-subunit dehydrogenase
VKKLDLSIQKSVRDFAADINLSEQKIDVLIHNAGYAETFKKFKTEDGIEKSKMKIKNYVTIFKKKIIL